MGGVLWYKWEAYCGTNRRCIAAFPFLQGLEASKAQRYKWEAYCGTNWRRIASTFQTSCTGWGFLNSAHKCQKIGQKMKEILFLISQPQSTQGEHPISTLCSTLALSHVIGLRSIFRDIFENCARDYSGLVCVVRKGQSTVSGPKRTKMDLFRPKWNKMDHLTLSDSTAAIPHLANPWIALKILWFRHFCTCREFR